MAQIYLEISSLSRSLLKPHRTLWKSWIDFFLRLPFSARSEQTAPWVWGLRVLPLLPRVPLEPWIISKNTESCCAWRWQHRPHYRELCGHPCPLRYEILGQMCGCGCFGDNQEPRTMSPKMQVKLVNGAPDPRSAQLSDHVIITH